MKVSLTPELEKLVQDQVNSGLYENVSEVIRDAIRHTFCDSASEPAWLEKEIAAGVKSPSLPVTDTTWKRITGAGQKKLTRLKKTE